MYLLFGHVLLCCLLSPGRVSGSDTAVAIRGEVAHSGVKSPCDYPLPSGLAEFACRSDRRRTLWIADAGSGRSCQEKPAERGPLYHWGKRYACD